MSVRIDGGRFVRSGDKRRFARDLFIDVIDIDLTMRLDFERRAVDARCTLTLKAIDRPLSRVRLDAVDFEIEAVADEDGLLEFVHLDGDLDVSLRSPIGPDDVLLLTVRYRIEQPRRGIYFVPPDGSAKATSCWTHGHDTDARTWIPCIDQPNVRQSVTCSITVPSHDVALGNGELVSIERNAEAATSTYRYRQRRPISAYLVTMVAGPFVVIEHLGASVPVRSFVAPGREADGKRAFAVTPTILAALERFTGLPYPYAGYAQVAVGDFPFVGMENATASTLTDEILDDESVSSTHRGEFLVAHELAHQWFGVLLVAREWSEIWLNEGFASYCEAVWAEHRYGWDEYVFYIREQFETYLQEANTRYVRAVACAHYVRPLELFDRHAYEKASTIIHCLRGALGEERFRRTIARYVRDNQDGAVETVDLARAAERETGRNIRGFLDQWVGRAGHPDLTISARYDATDGMMRIRVEQHQPIDAERPPFHCEFEIGFIEAAPPAIVNDAGPNEVCGERRERIVIDEALTEIVIAIPRRPALVRIDPSGWLPGTLERDLDAIHARAALRYDSSVVLRAGAAGALVRDGSRASRAVLEYALHCDPFWGVRREIATTLGKASLPWARDLVRTATRDADSRVRRAGCKALGRRDDPLAVDALLTLIACEPDVETSGEALRSLGKTRDARAYAVLIDQLARPSSRDAIAKGAVLGLGELGERRCEKVLLETYRAARSSRLKQSVVVALATLERELGDGRIVDTISKALYDVDLRVRQCAIDGLERIGGARVAALLHAHASSDGFDGRLRRYAERAAERSRAGCNAVAAAVASS